MTVVVLASPRVASAGEGGIADPRDVGTRVDLKTLTHAREGSAIVYTAETYAPFSDESAILKWGIDRDGDEAFDLIVFTEWREGKLTGGVKDAGGRQVAAATVSRPGPTAIKVAFPAGVLGDALVYRYAVDSGAAAGEGDVAPNSGLIQHRLGAAATTGGQQVGTASPPPASVATAPGPGPAADAAPKANLPTTGPHDRALLMWAGLGLLAGGVLVALGTRGNRVLPGDGMGGIR